MAGSDGARLEVRRRLYAQIARVVLEAPSTDPLALRLCRSLVRATGAEGGAITFAYTRPERTTLCATDGVADRLEDLREVLGQGQGADASGLGVPVSGDLEDESDARWAVFADAVRAAVGPVRLRALPMRTSLSTVHDGGADRVGKQPRLGDPRPDSLLPVHRPDESFDDVEMRVRRPNAGRAVIEQAKGVLAHQLGVDPGPPSTT